MAAASLVVEGGDCRIVGDLVFSTVTSLLAEGTALFKVGQRLVFDLGQVGHADSSGLVLLLEWLDLAKDAGVYLTFTNIPDSLQGIARLSNAESLLHPA
jgi:phospholipid transport system transporter-binding protein